MDIFVNNEVNKIVNTFKYKNYFKDKTILITGATGLIGSYLTRVLSEIENVRIIAFARNEKKVNEMNFNSNIVWNYSNLDSEIDLNEKIDYIIHTASPTDSQEFIEKPVEVINNTTRWLNNILTFAYKKQVSGVVFLSSLEVYGICNEDKYLNEKEYYSIDCNNVRNSYSEGKKILECLCSSYASEYNVPVKIVRLGQTFGPGVSYNDNRVFAQFARKIVENKNIVLSTKGETKRSYCSIIDAVNGIIVALLFGQNGESYNLASDDSYISIYDLAKIFIEDTKLDVEIHEEDNKKYLGTIKFGLDTSKLKDIGYISMEPIRDSCKELINYFKKNSK